MILIVLATVLAIGYMISDPKPPDSELLNPKPVDLPFGDVQPMAVAVDLADTVYVLDSSGSCRCCPTVPTRRCSYRSDR